MFPCASRIAFDDKPSTPMGLVPLALLMSKASRRDPMADTPLDAAFQTRNRTRDLVGVHKPRDSAGS